MSTKEDLPVNGPDVSSEPSIPTLTNRRKGCRRSAIPTEILLSDSLQPNANHPVAGVSREERTESRITALAGVLAAITQRYIAMFGDE